MERLQKLTTSQVKCFKECRRRYFLEYVKNLKPVKTPAALELGTLYHAGIEMLLLGANLDVIAKELRKRQQTACETAGLDYDFEPVVKATAMVQAFDQLSGWRDWNVEAVEKPFEVTTGYAKRLIGKIDGVIRTDEGRFLIEHKTTSRWGEEYLDRLQLDEQSVNYLYAYKKLIEAGEIAGELPKGIFYIVNEKCAVKARKATPMDQRKYTRDGRLYANQREYDESPAEYYDRLQAWYDETPRVHTAFIYRTPQEIDAAKEEFNKVLRDLVAAEREGTFYRNPRACEIMACPYRPKCVADMPDTDILFVQKTQTNEELAPTGAQE